ncbi:MAG: hypothetical protein U0795_23495 [Pirellulales bacterium]
MSYKTKQPNGPDAYRQRDLAICRLAGLYGVGVTESVNATIGGGSNLGHVVRRMADAGELVLHSRALDGGVSYFQLSEGSCERVGFPTERGRPLGTQALDKALAVLVWCTLSSARRFKIDRAVLQEILPGVRFPTNQVHCVSDEHGRRTVWRVMLVQGNHEPALKALQQEVLSTTGELQSAIAARQYGFVLLVESIAKQKVVEAAVERSRIRETALVLVDLSATAKTLAAYLRRRSKSK